MRGKALKLLRLRSSQHHDPAGDDISVNSKKLVRNGLVHNVIALYGVQACTSHCLCSRFPIWHTCWALRGGGLWFSRKRSGT